MIGEPWVWRETSIAARAVGAALSPLGMAYNAGQKFRWRLTTPAPAPLPVICIGNASLGGVGKTPFALMLGETLAGAGLRPHFLTRGYGGRLEGPVRVDRDRHQSADVGDEALLLAATAPTHVARDRPAGAAAAADAGAGLAIMDDGFQNPSLEKTLSFLLVDNNAPLLDGRVFPAGPLREPVAEAMARADALVVVKEALSILTRKELKSLAGPRPVFSVALSPSGSIPPSRVVAFCGLARPERFFASLERAGVDVAHRTAFPDHHAFNPAELSHLRGLATQWGVPLMTTEKDYVRLSETDRDGVMVFRVRMDTDDQPGLTAFVRRAAREWRENNRAAGGSERP